VDLHSSEKHVNTHQINLLYYVHISKLKQKEGMNMKKTYHTPVVETEKMFDVEAGDFALFGRCWGTSSPNGNGIYSHASGGCKD